MVTSLLVSRSFCYIFCDSNSFWKLELCISHFFKEKYLKKRARTFQSKLKTKINISLVRNSHQFSHFANVLLILLILKSKALWASIRADQKKFHNGRNCIKTSVHTIFFCPRPKDNHPNTCLMKFGPIFGMALFSSSKNSPSQRISMKIKNIIPEN